MQSQNYGANLFFDLLTTVVNKSKLWLTTVPNWHFTELLICQIQESFQSVWREES
ncbi:hypothetical protein SAMN04490195_2505 [Pseudomonas moorei]|uniref:Uncharacterized protein n=1 Tax=Pseudomonas moorei TaxID=395599 RepID=A0A1H1F4L2_9PSED|nr:hypothetical protein SAMN04490195_2505 [Pseudomonas moorei]